MSNNKTKTNNEAGVLLCSVGRTASGEAAAWAVVNAERRIGRMASLSFEADRIDVYGSPASLAEDMRERSSIAKAEVA